MKTSNGGKRLISCTLMAAMAAGLFAGCGNAVPDDGQDSKNATEN